MQRGSEDVSQHKAHVPGVRAPTEHHVSPYAGQLGMPGEHQVSHRGGARPVSHEHHLGRIAAEKTNVATQPTQCGQLVADTEMLDGVGGADRPAQQTEPVVWYGHHQVAQGRQGGTVVSPTELSTA